MLSWGILRRSSLEFQITGALAFLSRFELYMWQPPFYFLIRVPSALFYRDKHCASIYTFHKLMANISIIYISLPSRTLINIYNGVLKCLQSVFLGSHVYEPTVCNADQHRGWCTQFWIDEVSYTWIRTMGSYESSTQLFGGLFGNSFWAGSPCYFNIARSLFFFLRSVLSWWLLCTCTDLWSYSHIKLTCSGQLLAHELCYWFPILDWIRMLHPWCLLWFCQFGTSDNRDWFRLLDWIWML
jgi:hypothetical protein